MENQETHEMPIQLKTDFFEITLQDNTLDVVCEDSHLINMYNFLYDEGFRLLDINDRMELYRREGKELTAHSIDSMMQYLFDKLKSLELFDQALLLDVWDYFEEVDRVQKDLLMEHCLYPKTEGAQDKHQFMLLYDKIYRRSFQNDWMNNLFLKYEFGQVEVDDEGEKLPMYFKEVEDNQFLVFTFYRSEHSCVGMTGYDCWLSTHQPTTQSTDLCGENGFQIMKKDFDPTTDWSLIKSYLRD